MSGIRSTTGLISGIDVGGLVDALINAERAPARRLETRLTNTKSQLAGLGQLQAQLLTLSTSVQTLSNRRTFTNLTVQNSGSDQLTVTAKSTSIAGNYQFQSVRLASTQRSLSRGFANTDSQQIGAAGELTLTREGVLSRPSKLELLNSAQGVRRGTIRITDRSGATADVDLRSAATVDDVITAINGSGLGISARTSQGRIILSDSTGLTTSNLSVADLAGGHTAEDLGIEQSVAAATLTGSDIFGVTEDFTFALLNDGNSLRNISGQPDLSILLADGTALAVDLDGAATVGDVLSKINSHESNNGKLTAALQNGRLELTDATSGSGTLTVSNLNQSNAREVLGLTTAPTGGVITGQKLAAGANSVLLRNLRGGQGIEQLGELSLTDRTGATATVDLSTAETLDDVLEAINSAETLAAVPLQLTARRNAQGTGIEIVDTSGASASNLIIADVGGGTLATDLGIAVDAATTSIDSGALRLRTVNEATSLSTYSPRGTGVSQGSFRITDSAGNQAVINITSAERTLGDVLDRINAAAGIQVTARLNDTGDGFVLVDDAGGTGTLSVVEAGGRTAGDLRLLGDSVVGAGGQQEISSRRTLSVDIAATDTLNGIVSKINLIGGTIRASVVNSGSAINGFRLALTSTVAGTAGQFIAEEGALGLDISTQEVGQDALLRIGSNPETGFLVASSSNTFTNVAGNFDVTLKQVGDFAANVSATVDRDGIAKALQSFATSYNSYVDLSTNLTKFDTATQTRAALQGTSAPLTILSRFSALVNIVVGSPGDDVRSLADVGLKLTTGGKLTFDAARLNSALDAAPDQVLDLFAKTDTGFGVQFTAALDGFNDRFTGSLTLQSESLEKNIDQLTERIAAIDARLGVRRGRLELQFANLETILSGLQSQQTSLTGLTNILENLKASN
ncbi:MAG: flagellar filament capping protein FliD [Planctomycetaceae bacterium]|nr:flagellar filament capping protein FliD [Planctomycetaceae bacterium]